MSQPKHSCSTAPASAIALTQNVFFAVVYRENQQQPVTLQLQLAKKKIVTLIFHLLAAENNRICVIKLIFHLLWSACYSLEPDNLERQDQTNLLIYR